VLSVTVEHLDNGTGPLVLQYCSAEMVSTPQGWEFVAPPEVWRRGTRAWKRHTWQVRDRAFVSPPAGQRLFRLASEGWDPGRDLFVTFVGVDRSCLWLEPEPAVLPADGQSVARWTLTARDPAGQPLPDGTEVRLHAARGVTPQTVALTDGQATFDFRAGNRPGTGWVIAVCGERVERCPIYLLAGRGPAQAVTRRFEPPEIAEALRVRGEHVVDSSVSLRADVDGVPFVEVWVQLSEMTAGFPTAYLECPLSLDGVLQRLALEIGGDGSPQWIVSSLEDAQGENLIYTFWPMGAGDIGDWRRVELDARARAYSGQPFVDGVIDLPAKLPRLGVRFRPGTREGVFRLRAYEARMLCTGGQ
jgi:hypothetical protein